MSAGKGIKHHTDSTQRLHIATYAEQPKNIDNPSGSEISFTTHSYGTTCNYQHFGLMP